MKALPCPVSFEIWLILLMRFNQLMISDLELIIDCGIGPFIENVFHIKTLIYDRVYNSLIKNKSSEIMFLI